MSELGVGVLALAALDQTGGRHGRQQPTSGHPLVLIW